MACDGKKQERERKSEEWTHRGGGTLADWPGSRRAIEHRNTTLQQTHPVANMTDVIYVSAPRSLTSISVMPQDLLVQLSGASLAPTDDEFCEALLRAWSGVVKADYHSLIRHAPNGGRVHFWCPGEGRLGPDHWLPRLFAKLLALEASSESHPNTGAFLREGPGVYLRSALVDDRTWQRSEHYRLVDEPQGIRDMVCIFMKPMPDLLVTMHAGSHTGNFPHGILAAAQTFAPVAEALIRARGGFTDRNPAPAVKLSPREREILHWVGEGKRNAEIAAILQLSPLTVRKHLENIFAKLGVETRTAAATALRDNFAK